MISTVAQQEQTMETIGSELIDVGADADRFGELLVDLESQLGISLIAGKGLMSQANRDFLKRPSCENFSRLFAAMAHYQNIDQKPLLASSVYRYF